MGGYGSTRWGYHTKADTVDEYMQLDAGRLSQLGVLRANTSVNAARITWSDASGAEVASLGYDAQVGDQQGTVRLYYKWSRHRQSEDMDYRIKVVGSQRHVGGVQWYFICPLSVNGRACGRRAKKLYLGGKWYGCRRCYGLTYESCQESHLFDSVFGDLAAESGYSSRYIRRLLMDRLSGRA